MDWIPSIGNSFVIVPKGRNNQDSSYPGREGRAGGGCWWGVAFGGWESSLTWSLRWTKECIHGFIHSHCDLGVFLEETSTLKMFFKSYYHNTVEGIAFPDWPNSVLPTNIQVWDDWVLLQSGFDRHVNGFDSTLPPQTACARHIFWKPTACCLCPHNPLKEPALPCCLPFLPSGAGSDAEEQNLSS